MSGTAGNPCVQTGRTSIQAVAVAHGLVAGVDLALAGLAEALVDLVEVLADQLLLGLGDAAAVGLAGVLEGGVVDLAPARAARARPRPARRRPAPPRAADPPERGRLRCLAISASCTADSITPGPASRLKSSRLTTIRSPLRAPGAIHSTVTKRLAPWRVSTSSGRTSRVTGRSAYSGCSWTTRRPSDCSSASLPEMSDTWTTLTAIRADSSLTRIRIAGAPRR